MNEDFYVTGSFNNWNPKDEAYKLKPFGTKRKAVIVKDVPAGKYEFKFTRGSWEKGETNAKGENTSNREVNVSSDTIIYINIAGWKDDYPDKPKPNTATAQVKIIDSAFLIPQLGRTRRIWIYLPKSYAKSKKTYPVLYMHDGQNLFNVQTAPYGEWGVDEALDSLQEITKKEAIVVGIDHGGDKRMSEYNPYDHARFGKGEGDKYVAFLAQTLKPYIDKKYRTQKEAASTYVAGSSMGGLISLYALMKYPTIFGGAGVFSPAFWTAPSIFDDVKKVTWTTRPKFFFYAGGKEGESMVPDMEKMARTIESKGSYYTRTIISPLNKHNEEAWRKEFPDFYKWIMQ
jgi:predicted alpha/beta superfamily hydrolase